MGSARDRHRHRDRGGIARATRPVRVRERSATRALSMAVASARRLFDPGALALARAAPVYRHLATVAVDAGRAALARRRRARAVARHRLRAVRFAAAAVARLDV